MNNLNNITIVSEPKTSSGTRTGLYNASSNNVVDVVEMVTDAGETLLCLVGIPTNVLSCLVFWQQGLHDRMNMCLFFLSLVDCFYLMSSFAAQFVTQLILFHSETLGEEYHSNYFIYWGPVLLGLTLMSRAINTIIAVERCLCVTYPLQASNLIRTRTLGKVLVFLFLFSLTVNILFGCCTVHASFRVVQEAEDGNFQWNMTPPNNFQQDIPQILKVMYNILQTVVPLFMYLTMCTSATITAVKLKSAMRWRGKNTTSSFPIPQRSLTTMLMLSTCFYILVMTPLAAFYFTYFFESCMIRTICVEVRQRVAKTLVSISHISKSFHIFFYYRCSSRFRSVFHRTIRGVACLRAPRQKTQ